MSGNENIFSVTIKLTEEGGFTIHPEEGAIQPTYADLLLALQVGRDTLMNDYYQNVVSASEERDKARVSRQEFIDELQETKIESEPIEAVIVKANGEEV